MDRISGDAPTRPTVSIIVPVYNAAAYLPDLLASLLAQTEESLEILMVDDGSTDASPDILRAAAATDARIRIFTQANAGPSAARNLALDHVRGEWIAFADSDDWVAPAAFETWLTEARRHELELIIGNGFRFEGAIESSPSGPPIIGNHPWGQILSGRDWIVQSVRGSYWPHFVWLQMIRHEMVKKHALRFMPGLCHADNPWTLGVALLVERVGFCETPLYGYRRNNHSITGDRTAAACQHRARSYLEILPHLVATAGKHRGDAALRKALLWQVNVEAGHFSGLVRKRVTDPADRASLARRYLELKLLRPTLAGARSLHEIWRALRCWLMMRILCRAR